MLKGKYLICLMHKSHLNNLLTSPPQTPLCIDVGLCALVIYHSITSGLLIRNSCAPCAVVWAHALFSNGQPAAALLEETVTTQMQQMGGYMALEGKITARGLLFSFACFSSSHPPNIVYVNGCCHVVTEISNGVVSVHLRCA